jgi:hypothetical protein
MSDYIRDVFQKLYELKVIKDNGEEFSVGGLSIEKVSEYAKNAKVKGWKYEIINESEKAKAAWAKA